MTPEEEQEFDRTLLRSSMEFPYPLNYMRYYNPGAAYLMVKLFDKMSEHRGSCAEHKFCAKNEDVEK
jgi:hypothetical protein